MNRYSAQLDSAIGFLLLPMVFAIANRVTWLCVFETPGILFSCQYGNRTDELLLYLIVLGMILWLLYRRKQQQLYWKLWKENWILILFLAFSFVSVSWSVDRAITIYISLLITVSAMVGAYLGMQYRSQQWLQFITYFGVIVIILSYLLVAVLPGTAIMSSVGLVGDWRGAFAHKNYMGAIVSYCSAALLFTFLTTQHSEWRIVAAVFYLASIGLLIMSRSATGLILMIGLDGFAIAWVAFRKWHSQLTRKHYMLIGAWALTLVLVGLLNIKRILGLADRSTELTGRVPLWTYLIGTVKANHPWLGYGIGTVWDDPAFRAAAGYFAHWGVPIMNGHNGFVDVLLYLGVLGLTVFLATIVLAILRLIKFARSEGDQSFWPFMTVIYVLVVNLTVSFFFQFETFHWLLLVTVAFMVTNASECDEPGIPSISQSAA